MQNTDSTNILKNMTLNKLRPIRILHVVGGMSRGGLETWLMHILRHIDRNLFQMDFLVHTTQSCSYDDEIRALGNRIIPCPHLSRPWLYAVNFTRILREYGPYDVVHSHVHHFSGYVLRLAKQAGVPIRIAHSHNNTSSSEVRAGLYRRLYLMLMKRWIAYYATVGLAASCKAAADLFGADWEAEKRWQTLYCAIDLLAFHKQVDRLAVRAELGIPEDAFVIGHVGRFDEQKNHKFLIEIAAEIGKREPNMRLLMVGEGPLRPSIEQKVTELHLSSCVIFAGVRPDVPRLMLSTMDIFVLPSLYEGLPLVLMEAQAAGLPCIFSDVVSEEIKVVRSLTYQLSLSQQAVNWAEATLAAGKAKSKITQMEALRTVEQSPFNIQASVQELEKLYLANTP
jgi:glycosyltransferase involved in cell wall biosynthesis